MFRKSAPSDGTPPSAGFRPVLDGFSCCVEARPRRIPGTARLKSVLVYRDDRFARSPRPRVEALDKFRSLGIDFVSIHDGVDTSTAQ